MIRPQKLPVASPRGGNRGCLCPDGTYSRKCCDGSLPAQGIGALTGQGSTLVINSGEYEEEYYNILAVANSRGYELPSAAQRTIDNQLVQSLKASGDWYELDYLYMFANGSNSDLARINWINPTHEAQEVGTIVYSSTQGIKSNGTSYYNTKFSPVRDAVKMTPNTSCSGAWLTDTVTTNVIRRPYGIYRVGGSTNVKDYQFGVRTVAGIVQGCGSATSVVRFNPPQWNTPTVGGHIHFDINPPATYVAGNLSYFSESRSFLNGTIQDTLQRQLFGTLASNYLPTFPNNTQYEVYVAAVAEMSVGSGSTEIFDTATPANFYQNYIALTYGGSGSVNAATLYSALNTYISSL